MKPNKKRQILLHASLLVISLFYLLPIIWLVVNSFKPNGVMMSDVDTIYTFLPTSFTLENYQYAFQEYSIQSYILVTLKYCFLGMFFGIFVNGLAGYALAKYRFPGRKKVMTLVIVLIIVPTETLMITNSLVISGLHLQNTTIGYLLPMITSSLFIFMFRQFFISLEDEIEEAAQLDGCGPFRYFVSFVIPMSKPIITTISVFTFLNIWNDYLWALLVFNDSSKMPIQIGLTSMQNPWITDTQLLAAICISAIPIIIVYAFGQKYIVEGVAAMGSSKE